MKGILISMQPSLLLWAFMHEGSMRTATFITMALCLFFVAVLWAFEQFFKKNNKYVLI